MAKELIAFLNFEFRQNRVTIKSVSGETLTEVPRSVINWREYQAALAALGLKHDEQDRPLFRRYLSYLADETLYKDLVSFQAELRRILADTVRHRNLPATVWQRVFKDTDGLPMFITPEGEGDWTPESIGGLSFHYDFSADTYRLFVLAMVRELILNRRLFSLTVDEDGRFHLPEESADPLHQAGAAGPESARPSEAARREALAAAVAVRLPAALEAAVAEKLTAAVEARVVERLPAALNAAVLEKLPAALAESAAEKLPVVMDALVKAKLPEELSKAVDERLDAALAEAVELNLPKALEAALLERQPETAEPGNPAAVPEVAEPERPTETLETAEPENPAEVPEVVEPGSLAEVLEAATPPPPANDSEEPEEISPLEEELLTLVAAEEEPDEEAWIEPTPIEPPPAGSFSIFSDEVEGSDDDYILPKELEEATRQVSGRADAASFSMIGPDEVAGLTDPDGGVPDIDPVEYADSFQAESVEEGLKLFDIGGPALRVEDEFPLPHERMESGEAPGGEAAEAPDPTGENESGWLPFVKVPSKRKGGKVPLERRLATLDHRKKRRSDDDKQDSFDF